MEEIHFHVRVTSNGYYVRVTKGIWDVIVVKRFIAKNEEDLAKEMENTLHSFKHTGT